MTVENSSSMMEDMKLLYIREILAATVLLLATAGGAAEVHFIESPFGSLGKTLQLLDAADLRIMLPLGSVMGRFAPIAAASG